MLAFTYTYDHLVTHQSQSPTWLSRRSRHRIWLKDVQLYVFCKTYRQENMRQNKSGAFEIYFVSEEGEYRLSGHPEQNGSLPGGCRRQSISGGLLHHGKLSTVI